MKEARRPTPEIGMRMKELRESIGISQAVLAERINATQSSVNRYENGQSPPPLDYLRQRLLELRAYGSPNSDTTNMYRGDKSIGGLGIAGGNASPAFQRQKAFSTR